MVRKKNRIPLSELASASLISEIADQHLDDVAAAGVFTAGDDCYQPLSLAYGVKTAVCTAGGECGTAQPHAVK